MAKPEEKLEATKLRRQGKSIKDIAVSLGVSKGSVSLWCQDIKLTEEQKSKLHSKQIKAGSVGRQLGADRNKQKRLTAIQKHKELSLREVGTLSQRDLLLLGVGLYWGEGIKSRSGMASLVNSDPEVIKLGKIWFKKCLGVTDSDFRPYIYVSELHVQRGKEITNFWSTLLKLPRHQFKLIVLKNRPKKKFDNHNDYFGVLSLRIAKGTDLKYKILSLIDACKITRN